MKAGDIIFVRGDSPISNIIRFFDKGEFSHVAIAVSDTEIFEAQYYTRARIVKMRYEDYETVSLDLSTKEREKLSVICRMLTGKWYDFRQVIGYILRYFFNSDVSKFNNPNNIICSEALGLILYVLDRSDVLMDTITPNELYAIFNQKNSS